MAFKMKGWNAFSKENKEKRQQKKLFNKREKWVKHSHDAGAIFSNELSDDPTNIDHIKAYKKFIKYKNKLDKKS